MVGNRHDVTARGSGADNHAIRDAGFTVNINGDNILTFQIVDFINNKILECFTLQVFPLGI